MFFQGFDDYNIDPKLSAENVQCIHTSNDKGTRKRDCNQNWLMGNCGEYQDARGDYPRGSHGLCPGFYNSAFQYKFLAQNNFKNCRDDKIVTDFPRLFQMGYLETRKSEVQGTLFARTTKIPPHTSAFDFYFYDSSTLTPPKVPAQVFHDDPMMLIADCLVMKDDADSIKKYRKIK